MIVSRQNPKVKTIRRLRQCKGDSALLEGPNLIEEAIGLGLPLEIVLATPHFLESGAGRRLSALLDPTPLEVSPELLRELSDVDSPQGILAAATLPRSGPEVLPRVAGGLYVFAEGLQDPGNLGALARSVEAAGGHALALSSGCVHPNHPRALRASAGSLLRLAVSRETSIDSLRERLAGLDSRWIALLADGGRSLFGADLSGALVLALGAEGRGLQPATIGECDLSVSIPIEPAVESLNATVAASICLFEARRQRTPAI